MCLYYEHVQNIDELSRLFLNKIFCVFFPHSQIMRRIQKLSIGFLVEAKTVYTLHSCHDILYRKHLHIANGIRYFKRKKVRNYVIKTTFLFVHGSSYTIYVCSILTEL